MTREQSITENVEKLQKYVGLTIEVEVTAVTGGNVVKPLRVVGYNPHEAMLIVDGGTDGWIRLEARDIVAIRCDSYRYMDANRIIKVL